MQTLLETILGKMALARVFSRSLAFNKQCFHLAAIQNIQQRTYADAPQMAFTLASPAQVYYNKADVRQIDVPSFSGNFGILPNHVPVLAVIKPGVLTVFEGDGNAKKFFVSSGSITVNEDSSVQVLAEEAVPIDQIDLQACRDGLAKAQQNLGSATTEQAKAEEQIKVEVYEAAVKAVE